MSKQFFTVEENYKERFYQLPKVFFTNPNYKDLSNDAKIAYAILRDRLQLSIKNNWIDTEGNIYFIYTVADLEVILNCGNKKSLKLKRIRKCRFTNPKKAGFKQTKSTLFIKTSHN